MSLKITALHSQVLNCPAKTSHLYYSSYTLIENVYILGVVRVFRTRTFATTTCGGKGGRLQEVPLRYFLLVLIRHFLYHCLHSAQFVNFVVSYLILKIGSNPSNDHNNLNIKSIDR